MLDRRKTLCNGKIVVINFKKLNPLDFEPVHHLDERSIKDELALCAPDGRIYINSKKNESGIGYITADSKESFELLMKETKQTLLEYQIFIGKQYPNIKTFDDFITWSEKNKDGESRVQVFTLLMIPIELRRREIEHSYNGKIVDFPS